MDWISVETRLPKAKQIVIAYNEDQSNHAYYTSHDFGYFEDGHFVGMNCCPFVPSHWVELPEPPKTP